MTGKDVTECTGGDVDEVTETDLKNRYLTQCDPRYVTRRFWWTAVLHSNFALLSTSVSR